jgi:hypothetical protein
LLSLVAPACSRRRPTEAPPPVASAAPSVTVTPPVDDPDQQILRSFSAAPYVYQVAFANCAQEKGVPRKGPCKFVVKLLGDGRELDRIEREQPDCGNAYSMPVSRTVGADPDAETWTTMPFDRCHGQFGIRTVEIGPHTEGLLVSELRRTGEHRYRTHALLLARDRKLAILWTRDTSLADRLLTTTTVIWGLGEGSDIAVIDLSLDRRGVTEKVAARRLRFESKTGTMTSTALPDAMGALFVLQVGSFRNQREAGKRGGPCLEPFQLLRGDAFPSLGLPPLFAGAVYARRDLAVAAAASLASCPGAASASVVEWRFTVER